MPTLGSKAIPFSRRLLLDEARRTRACRPHDRAKTALHGVCSEKSGEKLRGNGARANTRRGGGLPSLQQATPVNCPRCGTDSTSRAIRIHGRRSAPASENNLFWFRADPLFPLPKAFHRAYSHIANAPGRTLLLHCTTRTPGGMNARPVQLNTQLNKSFLSGPSWRDFQ
jgi:hypothetical protein